jgi:hypothetical protein
LTSSFDQVFFLLFAPYGIGCLIRAAALEARTALSGRIRSDEDTMILQLRAEVGEAHALAGLHASGGGGGNGSKGGGGFGRSSGASGGGGAPEGALLPEVPPQRAPARPGALARGGARARAAAGRAWQLLGQSMWARGATLGRGQPLWGWTRTPQDGGGAARGARGGARAGGAAVAEDAGGWEGWTPPRTRGRRRAAGRALWAQARAAVALALALLLPLSILLRVALSAPAPAPPPPLVLSGHAASLTPY